MKLFAPRYYQQFSCIADRCQHTCCAGWEIDIDEKTAKKYATIQHPYGAVIRDSIEVSDGVPHFCLKDGERCPHLDDTGLCRIIREMGEDALCEICREHPRFYHITPDGMEVGLGMACEEACRLILFNGDAREMVQIGQVTQRRPRHLFDTRADRQVLDAILADSSLPYPQRLCRIYTHFGIAPTAHPDQAWHALLNELEYMDDAHRTLFCCYSSDLKYAQEHASILSRALAYFVFRHCSQTCDTEDFLASLGFCLFCERLLASLLAEHPTDWTDALIDAARILSEELEYSVENTERIKEMFLA